MSSTPPRSLGKSRTGAASGAETEASAGVEFAAASGLPWLNVDRGVIRNIPSARKNTQLELGFTAAPPDCPVYYLVTSIYV
jgi:hypothetical protein